MNNSPNPSKISKYTKTEENYFSDCLFDLLDIKASLSKNNLIPKVPMNLFLYSSDLRENNLFLIEKSIELKSSLYDKLEKRGKDKGQEDDCLHESKINFDVLNNNKFGIDFNELQLEYSSNYKVKFSELYFPLQILGQGAFGKVYLVKDKKGNEYVMKELEINEENKLEDVQREGEMMKLLNCRFITRFVDGFPTSEGGYNLVMEYCNGGDLEKVIKDAKNGHKNIPEDQVLKFFIETCLGVGYIHVNNMVHRDLKPANIFLMADKTVKIGDMGLTKKIGIDKAKTFCGTMIYMAPEILMQSPYDQKVDVWALGGILYEMMTNNCAFFDNNFMLLYQKILSAVYDPIETNYSQPLKDIVTSMLVVDAQSRPEIKDILKNDFLIEKSKSLGLINDLAPFIGITVQGKVPLNNEIALMQKYLIEDLGLDPDYFDFDHNNQDGGWAKDVEQISGFPYNPPHGWYGIGLNVHKLYPDACDNMSWIAPGRSSKIGSWPIAYHGLRPGYMPIKDKIVGIIKGGLRAGPNQQQANDDDLIHPGKKCGKGVYHYYNIKSLIYNQNVGPDDRGFMFIFMCRVNPDNIRQPKTNQAMWIINGDKNNTRPYRLLFRRVPVMPK